MPVASSLEVQMLNLINAARAAIGLAALTLNSRLNGSAENHSLWMLDADVFSHTGLGGSTPTDRIERAGYVLTGDWTTGENIAWQSERGAPGLSDDVVNLFESLMNSAPHRANILNPDFTEIGIGIELGTFTTSGSDWTSVMVTQNFARSSADNGGPGDGTDGGTDGGTGGGTDGGTVAPPVVLTGTEGKNRLYGAEGAEVINGLGGKDLLDGRGGDDSLFGGSSNDKLYGGDGADWLTGGTGKDLLVGGVGQDSFVFARGDGKDSIQDFQDNQDTLVFGGGLWDGVATAQEFVDRFAKDTGADVMLDFGDGQKLLLAGVSNIGQLYDDVMLIA